MANVADLSKIYVNLSLATEETNLNLVNLRVREQRQAPVLDSANDYEMAVIRFESAGHYLPAFIPDIDVPGSLVSRATLIPPMDMTTYWVAFNICVYSTAIPPCFGLAQVPFFPEDASAPMPAVPGALENDSTYYWIRSVRTFLDALNDAIGQAFTQAVQTWYDTVVIPSGNNFYKTIPDALFLRPPSVAYDATARKFYLTGLYEGIFSTVINFDPLSSSTTTNGALYGANGTTVAMSMAVNRSLATLLGFPYYVGASPFVRDPATTLTPVQSMWDPTQTNYQSVFGHQFPGSSFTPYIVNTSDLNSGAAPLQPSYAMSSWNGFHGGGGNGGATILTQNVVLPTIYQPAQYTSSVSPYPILYFGYYNLYEESTKLDLWSPIESIVFCAQEMPVATEIQSAYATLNDQGVQSAQSTSNNFALAFTDIASALGGQGTFDYLGTLLYAPTAEYRWVPLIGNGVLSTFDFQIYWRERRSGTLFPLKGSASTNVSMKLLLERKNY